MYYITFFQESITIKWKISGTIYGMKRDKSWLGHYYVIKKVDRFKTNASNKANRRGIFV